MSDQTLSARIDALADVLGNAGYASDALRLEAAGREVAVLESEVAQAKDALRRIVQWSEAYPLDVFPEPDFKRAHELLKAGGMTLDAISASNMRHVVEGVGEIARAALPEHLKEQSADPTSDNGS